MRKQRIRQKNEKLTQQRSRTTKLQQIEKKKATVKGKSTEPEAADGDDYENVHPSRRPRVTKGKA